MDVLDSRRVDPATSTTIPPADGHAPEGDASARADRPTPEQFYRQVARRPDVREILARLAR